MAIKPDQAKGMLQPARDMGRANMYDSKATNRALFQNLPLDLSVAAPRTNPYSINFPFRSLYMMDVPPGVEIYFKPNFKGSGQQWMLLRTGDVIGFDLPISGGYLSWAAQGAVTVELLAFIEVLFQTGRIISQNSGGVTISGGSVLQPPRAVTLGAAAAGVIAPANVNRNSTIIFNETAADLFVGDSTVTNAGATRGIVVPTGGYFVWDNTAALSGYSVAGGLVTCMDKEN